MVRNTTRTSGLSRLSSVRASMPFSCGMEMSVTITSGFSSRAAVTMARPSSTMPTSSNSSASRPFKPSATMRWSSASRTRGLVIGLPQLRDPRHHRGAAAGFALDLKFAIQQAHAFAHARKAETGMIARKLGVESAAVVAHRNLKSLAARRQENVYRTCVAVASGIAQCFLRDAEQAERRLLRECHCYGVCLYVYAQFAMACHAVTFRLERLHQAQVVEHRGVQAV